MTLPTHADSVGRCWPCRRAYRWRSTLLVYMAACPRCGRPLSRTTRELRSVAWSNQAPKLQGRYQAARPGLAKRLGTTAEPAAACLRALGRTVDGDIWPTRLIGWGRRGDAHRELPRERRHCKRPLGHRGACEGYKQATGTLTGAPDAPASCDVCAEVPACS